jgi:hypothetical protein
MSKEPSGIGYSEWVKAVFDDVTRNPPPEAVTAADIAKITGYSRRSIERMLKDKIDAGALVVKEYLVNKRWSKYYLPPEKKKAKPAKRKR